METLLRQAMLRASPLSSEERQAFEIFNRMLQAKLKGIEDDMLACGLDSKKVDDLRALLDKLPGLWP